MTVVCRPYRLEDAERDLLFRVKHGRRLTVVHFVLTVAGIALVAALLLSLPIGGLLADVAPAWAGQTTTVPVIGWLVTIGLGLFFARRMDAASKVVAPMPEQTVTVTPDGVHVATPVSVTDWRWTAWTRYHDLPEALMLEEPSGAMLILPARAFSDAAARAVARETMAAHLPLAEPAKKT